MTKSHLFDVDTQDLKFLFEELFAHVSDIETAKRPFPETIEDIPRISRSGLDPKALPELWTLIAEGATQLGSPLMSGHMDTAPHPYAVLTNTLVSALNNNMLFRELSPFSSAVEEHVIAHFIDALQLGQDWSGTWASGGSIANLTALFCAVGGYSEGSDRQNVQLFVPESGHTSLTKAASVLGIPGQNTVKVRCDDAGRLDVEALRVALAGAPAGTKPVVVAVLGTTIHGSVDDVPAIADLCAHFGAWLHIDAIYGGALMYSLAHRAFLDGVEHADSIVLGPQKWMYVPRVSAAVLIKGKQRFDERLGVSMPYSISGEQHRGFWGLQGSRPADAVVLWALLKMLGTDAVGAQIDESIALTQEFHDLLVEEPDMRPAHAPDLNLQVIETRTPAAEVQKRLSAAGGFWTSLAEWRGQQYLRSVLLSPAIDPALLQQFIESLKDASRT